MLRSAYGVTAFILLHAGAARADDKYDLADLQALEKQGSLEELVQHLGDISPSKRDATWVGLAERGASGWLGSLKPDEKNSEMLLATATRILERYPMLKQSRVFMEKRAQVGLDAYGWTFSNSRHSSGDDPWRDSLAEFVKADAVTADLPQRAAKKIQGRLVASVAWPFWKMALDRGAKVCGDADFQASIIEAIGDGVWADETGPVAKSKCWAELNAPLNKQIDTTKDVLVAKKLCALLKEKNGTNEKCK